MKVKVDNHTIELPENAKGVNIYTHHSLWDDTKYYTIEYYLDKKHKNTQSNTDEKDL